MEIFMFMMFLVSDLMVVLLCKFSYGNKKKYEGGMILAVHIPREEMENEEVKTLVAKTEKSWKRFNNINIIVSILICGLCFTDLMIFTLVWVVWLIEYIVGLEYLIIKPHRQMYAIKMKNGWINEKSQHVINVDARMSQESGKKAIACKWEMLPAAVILLLGGVNIFIKRPDSVWTDVGMVWFLASIAVEIVIIILHVLVLRNDNEVYSNAADVNVIVNSVRKKSWTLGLFLANIFVAISYAYVVAVIAIKGDFNTADIIVAAMIQLMSAPALIVSIIFGKRKQSEILEINSSADDGQTLCADDDEYWKKGWYNNPNDPRFLVHDRLNSMNYSMNYGNKKAKVFISIMWIIIAGTVCWTVYILVPFINMNVTMEFNEESANVSGAAYSEEMNWEDLEKVELVDAVDDDHFSKVNGGSTDSYKVGKFKGNTIKNCEMYVYTESSPVIRVTMKDGKIIFINNKDSGITREWYEKLESMIKYENE